MRIRELFPSETALVTQFYREAPDYWLLAEGRCDPAAQAQDFFTDAPPNCDPATSDRLGLFVSQRLSGVAELSYGFPEPDDAYIGLMLIGPWAQGAGHGKAFLAHVETLARKRHAPRLYLAVLEANPRGRAFWEREGFRATGRSGKDPATGHTLHRLVKDLQGKDR
jgi:GNAT superfamily N-acetyltransferase